MPPRKGKQLEGGTSQVPVRVQLPKDSSSDEAVNVDIPGEEGKRKKATAKNGSSSTVSSLVIKKTSAATASPTICAVFFFSCGVPGPEQAVHLCQLGDEEVLQAEVQPM